jgi:hypothetical protein
MTDEGGMATVSPPMLVYVKRLDLSMAMPINGASRSARCCRPSGDLDKISMRYYYSILY